MKIAGSGTESGSGPLVKCMDPRKQIRIRNHTKMSWIRNTAYHGTNMLHLLYTVPIQVRSYCIRTVCRNNNKNTKGPKSFGKLGSSFLRAERF
jgi:hypothetical protein